jgi:hypothetical protein
LNFYRVVPSFGCFERSPRLHAVQADLRGVAVQVLYVPRGPKADELDPRLLEFWRGYFHSCGVPDARFSRL